MIFSLQKGGYLWILCLISYKYCNNFWSVFSLTIFWQDGGAVPNGEISQREKARLKEMQRLKKQKIQEILDEQNAAIEADMVCLLFWKMNNS